jgi:hypothetical protein
MKINRFTQAHDWPSIARNLTILCKFGNYWKRGGPLPKFAYHEELQALRNCADLYNQGQHNFTWRWVVGSEFLGIDNAKSVPGI